MASAPVPPVSRGRRAFFWALLLTFLGLFTWSASVLARGTRGYFYVKSQPSGWRGPVVRPDARLAVAPVAGSRGDEIIATGVTVPARFDAQGFRVPLDGAPAASGPVVLAIGDSFTFGSGCAAEESYPWLVAQALHARSLNAAYPGYGLAQMLAQAEEMIPRFRPELLLLQFSPWLPSRAIRLWRSTEFDLLPYPFFAAGEGGRLAWHRPLFRGKAFDLPVGRYRERRPGLLDWASFQASVAFPLFAHDDPRRLGLALGKRTGSLPEMAEEREVAPFVYPEILRLCRASGTRMVVVVLEGAGKQDFRRSDLGLPEEVLVVDTKPGLYAELPSSDADTYLRAFAHWRGSPPRLIDEHPNARAHAIIARQVLRALSVPSSPSRSGSGGAP
jgi:hypothetical protein